MSGPGGGGISAGLSSAALVACSDVPTTAPRLASLAPTVSLGGGDVDPDHGGAVYTLTNAADGTTVSAFHRGADGGLTRIGGFATGGLGVGGTVDRGVALDPRQYVDIGK